MRTARARTSVEKRFPGFPLVMAYLPSFLLSGKPGLVHLPLTQNKFGPMTQAQKLLRRGLSDERGCSGAPKQRKPKPKFCNFGLQDWNIDPRADPQVRMHFPQLTYSSRGRAFLHLERMRDHLVLVLSIFCPAKGVFADCFRLRSTRAEHISEPKRKGRIVFPAGKPTNRPAPVESCQATSQSPVDTSEHANDATSIRILEKRRRHV